MLLETVATKEPELQFKSFDYRARNPLVVNTGIIFGVAHGGDGSARTVWATNEAGVVGMTGTITL